MESDSLGGLGGVDQLILEHHVVRGYTSKYLSHALIRELTMRTSFGVLDRDFHSTSPRCSSKTPGATRSARMRPSSKACSTGSKVVSLCSAIHFVPVFADAKKSTRW